MSRLGTVNEAPTGCPVVAMRRAFVVALSFHSGPATRYSPGPTTVTVWP
jgi:hypothetical protein